MDHTYSFLASILTENKSKCHVKNKEKNRFQYETRLTHGVLSSIQNHQLLNQNNFSAAKQKKSHSQTHKHVENKTLHRKQSRNLAKWSG